MKILFIAVFAPNSTNVSQSRGFKDNGCEVYEYDYRARALALKSYDRRDGEIIKIAELWKPDLVIFSKCNQMHYRVVEGCNKYSKTCMWYMDALHNFDTEFKDKVTRCNYFVSGVEGVADHGLSFNENTTFINQCPDEKMNFMLDDVNYVDDVTFIGSADSSKIHGDRSKYIKIVRDKFTGFKHYNGVYGLEHNKVVNQSKINLNFSPTDATGASVRIYKILASGGFLLTTPWKDMEKTFTPNENIVIFNSEKELIEKIDFYLENDEERNRIRLNGYKKGLEFLPKQWAEKIINYCK